MNPGHVLVVSKRFVVDYFNLKGEEVVCMWEIGTSEINKTGFITNEIEIDVISFK